MSDLQSLLRLAAEAREAAEKATPGPWRLKKRCDNCPSTDACGVESEELDLKRRVPSPFIIFESDAYDECSHVVRFRDAHFIALARTAVPELARGVEMLTAQLAASEAENERLRSQRAGLLEQCAQQTERLTTWESEAHRCRAQLAAALAAKEEACDIADDCREPNPYDKGKRARIAELRQVGRKGTK